MIAAFLGASLSPSPAAAARCTGAKTVERKQGPARVEAAIICLINKRRAAVGSKPLRWNRKLRRAAVRHSIAMVSEGFFAHTSPSGEDFVDRIQATGYTRGARRWILGESLSWSAGGRRSTPAGHVKAWMASPPHRATLLRPRFREVGIGAVRGTPFGRPYGPGLTVSAEFGLRDR